VLKISKEILGTKSSFLIKDDGSVCLSDLAMEDAWTVGFHQNYKSVEIACRALGIEMPEIVAEEANKFWLTWKVRPPASAVMSHSELLEKIKTLNSWFSAQFSAYCDSSYFCNDFQSILLLLDRLEPALLDSDFVRACDDERISSLSGSKSASCTYDPCSSSTGRLTVKSGFPILTLPRELRKSLKSRHGKILQIDFTALEPHTLRCFAGRLSGEEDIYTDISRGFDLERDIVKVAVMSACYGMSRNSFRSKYRSVSGAAGFYDSIRKGLGVEELESYIARSCVISTGITNGFGRPIQCDPAAWVSHFVQSTAVDVACQGFNDVIDRLAESRARFSPLFLIHDSLVVDVNVEHMSALNRIVEEGFLLKSKNYKFPMKIKELY